MAIQTMDSLLAGLANARKHNVLKASMTTEGAGTFQSLLKANGYPIAGATPPSGSGEIPISTATYALGFNNPTGGNKTYLARVNLTSSTVGSLIIYDRLWHNSGLVGNILTTQTVGSNALTRYTDGEGVEIYGEVYTAMGATASTFSVNYTDANNSAQVATYAHPANALTVGQMFQFVPPTGAKGAKSIQSVILSASTGTAGNFGLVMLRRIAEIPMTIANMATVLDAFSLGLPEIQNNACLNMMVNCSTTASGNIMGTIDIVEG